MPELPEEAVRAAEDAYRCAHTSGVPEREIARIVAVAAVEAAAPAIAAQERAIAIAAIHTIVAEVRRGTAERIAAAILGRGQEQALDCWCHDVYAEIARQIGEARDAS